MATNNNEAAASGPPVSDPLASYREHYAEVAHSAIVRDAWSATADAIQKIAAPTPPVEQSIHAACIDMLAIVFDPESTDDEKRMAATTIVEAVAPDILAASLPPEIQAECEPVTPPTPPAEGAESLLPVVCPYCDWKASTPVSRIDAKVLAAKHARECERNPVSTELRSIKSALRTAGMPEDAEPGEWVGGMVRDLREFDRIVTEWGRKIHELESENARLKASEKLCLRADADAEAYEIAWKQEREQVERLQQHLAAEGAESLKELTILRDYIGLAEGERAVAFERGRLIVDGPGGRRDARMLLNSVDLAQLRSAGMPEDAEPGEWIGKRIDRLELAYSTLNDAVCQTLGKVLGYPWYKDDQENFPGATEVNGVCVGDHVAESIACEAAGKLTSLTRELEEARQQRDGYLDTLHELDAAAERVNPFPAGYRPNAFEAIGELPGEFERVKRDLEEAKRERDSRYASWRKLTEAIVAPRPRCRDCADSDGTCSTDGLPCDPTDLAIEVHRRLQQQLAAILRTLQRYQPGGSPPPGDEIVLANWILQSLQQQLAAEKERAGLAEQLADDAILVAQVAEHDGVNFHEPIGDIVGSIEIRKGTSDNANWLSLPCEYREDEAGWVFPVVTDEIRAALKAGLQETAPGDFSEFEERQTEYQSEYQSALTAAQARIAELEALNEDKFRHLEAYRKAASEDKARIEERH